MNATSYLPTSPEIAAASRFDWYEMTIDDRDDGRIPVALSLALGGTVTRAKGRNGYASCQVVERSGEVLAQVYGSSARHGEAHVVTSSEACDEVVPLLRRLYAEHRVSRVDVSADFRADFETLDAYALELAARRSLSHRLITDSSGGATRYLGSPSSELRVRVYKKTEQLRSLHPERAADIPDGIVRVELQARPSKRPSKERVSTMEPADVWGLGRWTSDLASDLLGFDAERVPTHFRKPANWVRGLHFLKHQYGPMVERRVGDVGLERARAEVLEALGLIDESEQP